MRYTHGLRKNFSQRWRGGGRRLPRVGVFPRALRKYCNNFTFSLDNCCVSLLRTCRWHYSSREWGFHGAVVLPPGKALYSEILWAQMHVRRLVHTWLPLQALLRGVPPNPRLWLVCITRAVPHIPADGSRCRHSRRSWWRVRRCYRAARCPTAVIRCSGRWRCAEHRWWSHNCWWWTANPRGKALDIMRITMQNLTVMWRCRCRSCADFLFFGHFSLAEVCSQASKQHGKESA